MANELIRNSQSRQGAPFLWITIHTSEGAYGNGAAYNLLDFFSTPGRESSCHAIADDNLILDNLVPYDRAAWTLRNGNNSSDNLELCARAGWSRATWMARPGLLTNAARWIAARSKARGIDIRHLSVAEVKARRRGVIGHVDYTYATNDGTHWDPGPNFPWDYVLARAKGFANPGPTIEEVEAHEVVLIAAQKGVVLIVGDQRYGLDSKKLAELKAQKVPFYDFTSPELYDLGVQILEGTPAR